MAERAIIPEFTRVRNQKRPGLAARASPKSALKQVPQELVVYLVMELDLLGFYERSQRTRATIGRSLLQVRIPAFHILAQQSCSPLPFAEVIHRVIDIVGQIALRLAKILDL